MGPRSDNRGYGCCHAERSLRMPRLQWVHGPITVVMPSDDDVTARSQRPLQWVHGPITVVMLAVRGHRADGRQLQWVHGPITVVMASCRRLADYRQVSFNGSTVR